MFKQAKAYFINSKEELAKVSWPSRDDVVKKTLLVIAISVGVATYLGFADYGLTKLLDLIV